MLLNIWDDILITRVYSLAWIAHRIWRFICMVCEFWSPELYCCDDARAVFGYGGRHTNIDNYHLI